MSALAVLLVGAAAWVWMPPGSPARARGLVPRVRRDAPQRRGMGMTSATGLATACAALGALLLVGGAPGFVLAVGCLITIPRLARRLEPRAVRERRTALAAQAPLVADLLAATMAAGSPVPTAVRAVCEALDDPARSALRPVLAALDLGADARAAWQPVLHDASLGAIVAAAVRTADSGAPLAALLTRIADDLRREHRVLVGVAARSAGVRAVLPLAACFLPAFLLLGVVPVVASLAGGLLG